VRGTNRADGSYGVLESRCEPRVGTQLLPMDRSAELHHRVTARAAMGGQVGGLKRATGDRDSVVRGPVYTGNVVEGVV
jgi:hypothetical protein